MRSNNHSEILTTEDKSLRVLVENAIAGKDNLIILERFTTVSHSYTDEFAYAVVDTKIMCIYFLADTVSNLDKQKLIARARHIPTIYGYLFYLGEGSKFALDDEFKEVKESSVLLSNIKYIDFESNYKNWRDSNDITITNSVKDLRKKLQTKYGVSNEMAKLLICFSKNTLHRKTPLNSILISKSGDSGRKHLYRYLSNEAFFRIISSSCASKKTLSYGLSSICSMNDCWEYSFGIDPNGKQVYFRDSNVQDTFIMSLSKVAPDNSLDMWRLYGEDAKGICLEFEVEPGAPVYKVTYRKGYEGIPLYPFYIKSSSGNMYAFPMTKHTPVQLFSQKSKKYGIEKEARLIVIRGNINLLPKTIASPKSVQLNEKWVSTSGTPFPMLMMEECNGNHDSYIAPLVLKRVFIGPNSYDSALKKGMIIKRLQELGVSVPVEIVKDFGYKPSE